MMTAVGFFQGMVQVLDHFVIVLSLIATAYLVYNFNTFYRKYVVASYILVLSLFSFWSIRWVLSEQPIVTSLPFLSASFLMDLLVVTFTASIIYHFERLGDVKYVRHLFGLQHVDEAEVVEYGGPQLDDLAAGQSYLVIERGFSYEWKLLDELSKELPTLCFTRKHPSKIDIDPDEDGRDLKFFWLSESETESYENVIEPFRRGEMQEQIMTFVQENRNPVILIDGLEYLVYKNSAEAIVDFIQDLNDQLAHRRDTILIYSLDKDGVPDKTYSLIKEETDEVRYLDDDGELQCRTF